VLPATGPVQTLLASLGGHARHDPDRAGTSILLETGRSQFLQPLIDELRRLGITIDAIIPQRQSLEDYFIGVVTPASAAEAPAAAASVAAEPATRRL
jgi:hypothetical protein